MGAAPTSSFIQMQTRQGVVDVYFRTLYKINQNFTGVGKRTNDNESVVSGYSNLPGEYGHSNELLKKSIQLCISFNKNRNSSNSHHVEIIPPQSHSEGPEGLKGSLECLRRVDGSVYINKNDSVQSNYLFNAAEEHWNQAVNQFFHSFQDDAIDTLEGPNFSQDDIPALSNLSAAISRFAMPDAVVEFDWSELGNWHLLHFHLETRCWVPHQ
jgi:hypothetical protein